MAKNTIAVVFDFDDTIVPDSTTALLKSVGVDANNFWQVKYKKLIKNGYDPAHAYLHLLLNLTKPGQPLANLTNAQIKAAGATLEPYKGISRFFNHLQSFVSERYSNLDVALEFYVISGGLEEMIGGCEKISSKLTAYWGCRFGSHSVDGPITHIKRAISFTEKTRYLFEINKGLQKNDTDENPFLVNKCIAKDARRVPFKNMIYVGDGFTDIPCFSLVKAEGGIPIAVVHNEKEMSERAQVFRDLVTTGRAMAHHSPKYGKNDDLCQTIKTAILNRCSEIWMKEKEAFK